MVEKLIKFIQKINYGNWGNKKKFENKIKVMSDIFKTFDDKRTQNIISYRNSITQIIAGTIAFIGFLISGGIKNDIYFKAGVLALIIFIVFGIIGMIISYNHDGYVLDKSLKYVNEQQSKFINWKNKINKFDFGKEEFDDSNNNKFEMPKYIKSYYFVSFINLVSIITLIIGLLLILVYYIKIIF